MREFLIRHQKRGRIHHDDDSSFMSLVKDYIRFMSWSDTVTEGYDHNGNARVERRNRKHNPATKVTVGVHG